jgi:uncharacterized repeat protein (TIGR03837 family)
MLWDIFCKVIDNHGDIGVCWRLSAQLAAQGEQVRLWVDDASALAWMAPEGSPSVQVLPWDSQTQDPQPGDVVIEAFGCQLEPAFEAALASVTRARGRQPPWINLEYLTAEPFAERNHGLPSPILAGPAAGLTKHFFYPGFTARTGGLLREPDLALRQARFNRDPWLRTLGIDSPGARIVSLFCYAPAALGQLLDHLSRGPDRVQLLVTAGQAAAATRETVQRQVERGRGLDAEFLSIHYLPLLSQLDFDHLLWACDLNFVRGEDSLVRSLWAGKPLVWQLYPQHDGAHHAKLSAFLDWIGAPTQMADFHSAWNGTEPLLPAAELELKSWGECVQRARQRLFGQDDLVTQLMRFAGRNAQGPA